MNQLELEQFKQFIKVMADTINAAACGDELARDLLRQHQPMIEDVLRDKFVMLKYEMPVNVLVYDVSGYVYERYILHPIIELFDTPAAYRGEEVDTENLVVYDTVMRVSQTLWRLEQQSVIISVDASANRWRQGPRFVEFCEACGFPIGPVS